MISVELSERVTQFANPYCTYNFKELAASKVAVVLGTSKWHEKGKINLYFKYRIDAAVRLFKTGKVEYILVSGDNGTKYYNEPKDFQQELIRRGIPADRIILDYAGFRTLDSMIRANKVFGLNDFIVVSQRFHNERAVFIARKSGLNAYGYNARKVVGPRSFKTRQREKLARLKLYLDIYILDTQPKFLGDPVRIY